MSPCTSTNTPGDGSGQRVSTTARLLRTLVWVVPVLEPVIDCFYEVIEATDDLCAREVDMSGCELGSDMETTYATVLP